MSLFGDLDVNEIPDDPNYVEAGIYCTTVTEAKFLRDKDTDEVKSLLIKYTIDEPENDWHHSSITEFYQYPLDKKKASWLMKRLTQGLGYSKDEAGEADPEDFVGKIVYVKVKNNPGVNKAGESVTYTNVADAWNPDLWAEKQEESASRVSVI